ncbi:TPA: plasmid SOS inhibition protein A, partial [Escherichia coli]
MSARSRALIPLSAEQQAAMQAVAVTEQRRRQGRTLSAWPYASAFFRCLNGSRRISLTDLRFFAPALTKEEFHGNRLLWLAAVDKLIETHIMRLLISLWDVGTVFFTIYPQVFRHEKSSIYYK